MSLRIRSVLLLAGCVASCVLNAESTPPKVVASTDGRFAFISQPNGLAWAVWR